MVGCLGKPRYGHRVTGTPPAQGSDIPRKWHSPVSLAVSVLVVAIAYRDHLDFGFIGDARFLLEHNVFLHDLGSWWGQLTHDYFWSSSGNTIPYWRPWTKLSWLCEWQLLGGSAAAFHLVHVVWHLVAVAGAWVLTRAVGGGPFAAACAALMFGLGPAAIEPASLLMARSDVVAAAACVWAVWAWLRWLQTDHSGYGAAHIALLVLALGSKETCVVLAPALGAWSFLLVKWQELPRRRAMLSVLPAVVLVVVMLALRHGVVGGREGAHIELDPWRVFVGGGRYLSGLLPLRLETGIRNVGYDEAASLASVAAAGFAWACALAVVAAALRFRDAHVLGLLTLLAGTLAPVLLVEQMNVPNVEGKFPMADRWVLQASMLSSVILASRWHAVVATKARSPGVAAVALWALMAVALSSTTHGMYATEIALLDKEDIDFELVPEAFRSQEDRCRFRDRVIVRAVKRNEWAAVLQATADDRCPFEMTRSFNRLSALSATGQWRQADVLASTMLGIDSADTRHVAMLRHLRGRARLRLGKMGAALVDLRIALKMGLTSCGLYHEVGVALQATGSKDQAQKYLAEAQRCVARAGR